MPFTFNAVRESYNYSTGVSVYESEPFETVHCPYNPAFDALPGELPAGSENATNGLFLSYLKTNSAMNGRITAHYLNPQLMDTCLKTGFFDEMWGWDGMHIMGEGIGTVESRYNYWMQYSGEWDHQRLICYAKNGEYWNGFCDQLVQYVGVDPELAFSSFEIYPQPAQNSVILDFGEETLRKGEILLFSMNGQLLRTTAIPFESTFSIDISDLPDGMYLLQLRTSEGNSQLKKLVVIR